MMLQMYLMLYLLGVVIAFGMSLSIEMFEFRFKILLVCIIQAAMSWFYIGAFIGSKYQ